MTKSGVITEMNNIKSTLESYPNFKGRAAFIRKVKKHIHFMTVYKIEKSVGMLLMKDCQKALRDVHEIIGWDSKE